MSGLLFDSVQIGAEDPAAAADDYARLLGIVPTAQPGGTARFALATGAVEIVRGRSGIASLTFLGAVPATFDVHGVAVHVVGTAAVPGASAPDDAAEAIDHVVVRSVSPERAIACWRDQHGLRLALDREFPERHLRLLFFRSNHVTLEYATPLPLPDDRSAPDAFYGITFRVSDLAARRTRLVDAGVDVSAIRPGMRPGTVVATVRSATAGVPTLLLGPQP